MVIMLRRPGCSRAVVSRSTPVREMFNKRAASPVLGLISLIQGTSSGFRRGKTRRSSAAAELSDFFSVGGISAPWARPVPPAEPASFHRQLIELRPNSPGGRLYPPRNDEPE